MTAKIIEKLKNLGYHNRLQAKKELYSKLKADDPSSHRVDQERKFIYGYLSALRDTKVLSDAEFRAAFIYYTL